MHRVSFHHQTSFRSWLQVRLSLWIRIVCRCYLQYICLSIKLVVRPVMGYIEFQITGTWTSMRQCWRRWRKDLEITLIPRITSTPKTVKLFSPLNFPLCILHLYDLEVSVLSLLRLQFPKFLGRLFYNEHLNFKNITNSLHQQLMVSQKMF